MRIDQLSRATSIKINKEPFSTGYHNITCAARVYRAMKFAGVCYHTVVCTLQTSIGPMAIDYGKVFCAVKRMRNMISGVRLIDV